MGNSLANAVAISIAFWRSLSVAAERVTMSVISFSFSFHISTTSITPTRLQRLDDNPVIGGDGCRDDDQADDDTGDDGLSHASPSPEHVCDRLVDRHAGRATFVDRFVVFEPVGKRASGL